MTLEHKIPPPWSDHITKIWVQYFLLYYYLFLSSRGHSLLWLCGGWLAIYWASVLLKCTHPVNRYRERNLGDRDSSLSESLLDHISEKCAHFKSGSTTVSKNSHGRTSPRRLPHVLCRSPKICLLIWSRNWPPLKDRSVMNGAYM